MVEPLSRPLLEEQTVLAGRFRLHRPLSDDPEASWLAHDDVLDREVVVLALAARDSRGRELVQEAGYGGAVAHAGLARVYDAAHESRPPRPRVAYVVREWIDGLRLPQALHEGPLRPARALEVVTQVTEALAALHASDTGHGRVHPGNVILDRAGRAHLTDAGVAAVRADVQVDEAQDVRDVGALLYALTTGRWPAQATTQPGRGIPPAPTNERGLLAPRLVRAAVPEALDALVMRVLEPGKRLDRPPILTAAGLLTALQQTADAVGREERDALPPEPGPPPRWRKYVPYAGIALGLVVLSTCSYSVGQEVGEVKGAEDSVATIDEDIQPSRGAAASTEAGVDLTRLVVRDFDPYGRPQRENAGAVVNAYDLAPSTAWTTSFYRSKALGGLKPGVGLLVDLGRPTPLSRVLVDLSAPGATLELRAANALGEDEKAFPVLATGAPTAGNAARLTLRPATAVSRRYLLLWFTELPADGSQFRAGIKEFAVRQARR